MLTLIDIKYKKWISAISYTLFIAYIIIAVILLFLSPYRQAAYELNSAGSNPYNIIPFKTITDYIKASSHINQNIWMSNLFGNVLAFFPMGVFLPWLFKRFIGFWRTTSTVFLATLTVEILQFATRVGSFDIDDIILNTLGGAIGYLLIKIIYLLLLKERTYED
ncbi:MULTISPECIES: VanZ family protein [Mesobacillus]|uniref:VanZ family protein n=1 Tax=Mesobacillus TaxID=2675231 RepID=UPI00177C65AC|nr:MULTISPECIES: VanZ family protein [Mesobacillus]MCM3573928.1 VanZ family protein [Mesobacillus subterraneus]UYZ20307.1 VanZ family protein [Mesobacillus jeotgali]